MKPLLFTSYSLNLGCRNQITFDIHTGISDIMLPYKVRSIHKT